MQRIDIAGAILAVVVATSAAAQAPEPAAADQSLGHVHFPVSCVGAEADFDRAVAMLHSFWYEAANRAFGEIAKLDPACAMAEWGLAMTLYHPLWDRPTTKALQEGRTLLAQARAGPTQSPRERAYIDALASFYADDAQANYSDRALAYAGAMARLHTEYPEDREASAFYALAMLGAAQALPPDKTYAREKQAAMLLNGVLAQEPRHPGALHYLIHAYDEPPLAALALDAARTYGKIAPAAPHAQHMPSHIFTRLGLWQESIASNVAAATVAKRAATEMGLPGAWDEQLHAMDYLEYAYLQRAQDAQAKTVLDELLAIKKTSPESFKVAYAYAAVPARYAIERRRWAEARSLALNHPDFPWDHFPWAEAITQFARALGAARSGDRSAARASVERLTTLEDTLRRANDGYWAAQVKIQRLAASAWLAHADRHDDEALRSMRAAADLEDTSEKRPVTPGPIVPARELLGELLLELDKPAEAMAEFDAVLVTSPSRFGALLGAARAAKLATNSERARERYAALLRLTDGQRPELAEARAYLHDADPATPVPQ